MSFALATVGLKPFLPPVSTPPAESFVELEASADLVELEASTDLVLMEA